VTPGTEGAPWIDDDVDQTILRIPPGRPDSDPARDLDRPVEVGPPIGPVIGNGCRRDIDEGAARGGLQLSQIRDLPGRTVDRELDPAGAALLLQPVGSKLEQVGHHLLRVLRLAANRETDHLRRLMRGDSAGEAEGSPVS
jgi:hypothetical protein